MKIAIPPFIKTVKYRHVLNESELTEYAQRIGEILVSKAWKWNLLSRKIQYDGDSDIFSTAFCLSEMPLQDIVEYLRNQKVVLAVCCGGMLNKRACRCFDTEFIDEKIIDKLFERMKGRFIVKVSADRPEDGLVRLLKTTATNLRRKRLHQSSSAACENG